MFETDEHNQYFLATIKIHEAFIDEDAYNTEKTVDFKLLDLIKKTRAKNKSGYHTPGSSGCYYHLATEPRYYYDPSF